MGSPGWSVPTQPIQETRRHTRPRSPANTEAAPYSTITNSPRARAVLGPNRPIKSLLAQWRLFAVVQTTSSLCRKQLRSASFSRKMSKWARTAKMSRSWILFSTSTIRRNLSSRGSKMAYQGSRTVPVSIKTQIPRLLRPQFWMIPTKLL